MKKHMEGHLCKCFILKIAFRRTFYVMHVANFLSVKICNWGSKKFVTQSP